MKHFFFLVFFLAAGLIQPAFAQSEKGTGNGNAPSSWEKSIVHIDVTRKQYDYTQPWSKRMKKGQKVGIVMSDKEILTTADELFDRTLIRIQKGGRGKWWAGNVTWIDYHANLAIVTCSDDNFWNDLQPAQFAKTPPGKDVFQIMRWREGKLETRRAEFNQYTVDTGHLTFASHVQLQLISEIQGAGWGEPVIADSKIAAIICEHNGNKITSIPASFILPILEARKSGDFRGLGFFDFYWQPAQNPANVTHLKLSGEPRGVIVNEIPERKGVDTVLKSKDILLQIDGFDIDIEGDYVDPDYGPLSLENLSTRGKWAGDNVQMKVWRDGKVMDITYKLPRAEYSSALIPDAAYDQEPEYLIVGGFVFQPLNDPYLQSWGPDWKRRSPFRLYYFNHQDSAIDRPSLVFLSQVLPDPYNIGFQDMRYLVLDKVNGQKIATLAQLYEALKQPMDGFHHIQFMQSDSTRKIVLAADGQDASTQRVLQRYGISKGFHLATPPKANTAAVGK